MSEPAVPPAPLDQKLSPAPVPPSLDPQELLDTDLVYIDPATRSIVGKVEWKGEKPKSLPYQLAPGQRDGAWRKHYPWGTMKSMRRIFKVGGKVREAEPSQTLDEVLPKALEQAYWN